MKLWQQRARQAWLLPVLVCGGTSCKTTSAKTESFNLPMAEAIDDQCKMSKPNADLTDLASHFYDEDRISTVDITMDPNDWETLRNQTPTSPCKIDPNWKYDKFKVSHVEFDGIDLGTFKIKKKSICGSLSTTKPGVDLDKNDKDGNDVIFPVGQGEVGLSRLIFNNSAQDPAYMRQCFSYKMIRDQNYPAPLCNYVKMCVNGKYKGLYINVEALDEQFAARNFNDKQSKGIMMEGDWTGDMSGIHADFYPDGNAILNTKDANGQVVTHRPWDVWGVKFPKDKDSSNPKQALQDNLSRQEYADFMAVLIKNPDDVTVDDVATMDKFVDIEKYRKFYQLEYLLGNFDGANGNQNNYYTYFDPNTGKWNYLPWGMDQTLQGVPKWDLAALRLAHTFFHSKTLRKGLADDYAKMASAISEPDRKAAVLKQGALLKPLLSQDEQNKWDSLLDNMTYNFWRELNTNPFAAKN